MENYKLVRRIGSGRFGIAYLARKIGSGDYYVLKEINTNDMSEDEVKKIALEIKVLSSIYHEYIVRYYDYFKHNNKIYIIMEYCSGGDMHTKIYQQFNVPFKDEQVFRWLIQTALVLHYLHSKKIIHRDIKPHNIFLDSNNNIKVGDFGISRVLQFTQDMAKTAVGTPLYVAPEVVKGIEYDAKADVWSLGCTFYEIVTLTPPFNGMNLSDLMSKIKAGSYRHLSSHYNAELKDLIESMIVVNPSERPTIDQILMKPACMKRLHVWFPKYIPTLFPYSVPIVNSPQGSSSHTSVSSSQPSTSSKVSHESHHTKVSHESYHSKVSHESYPTKVSHESYPTKVSHESYPTKVSHESYPTKISSILPISKNHDSNSSVSNRSTSKQHSHKAFRLQACTIHPSPVSSMTNITLNDNEKETGSRRISLPTKIIDINEPSSDDDIQPCCMKYHNICIIEETDEKHTRSHSKYKLKPMPIQDDIDASSTFTQSPVLQPSSPPRHKCEAKLQSIQKETRVNKQHVSPVPMTKDRYRRKESVKPLKGDFVSSAVIPPPLVYIPYIDNTNMEKEKKREKEKEKKDEHKAENKNNYYKGIHHEQGEVLYEKQNVNEENKKDIMNGQLSTKLKEKRRRNKRQLYKRCEELGYWHSPTTKEINDHNNALFHLRHNETKN